MFNSGSDPADLLVTPLLGSSAAGNVTAVTDPLTGRTVISAAGIEIANSPSELYKFFIPGSQFVTSGNAKDKSGNGADAEINASYTDSAAWANNGYITTGGGTDLKLTVPVAKSSFDLGTESVIIALTINAAVVGGTDYVFGNNVSGGAEGFRCFKNAAGKLEWRIGTSVTTYSVVASTPVFADSTDHALLVAWDALTKAMYLYRDGCLCDTYSAAFTGTTTPVHGLSLGAASGYTGASFAAKYRGIHMLTMVGRSPINLGLMAQKIAAAPMTHLTDMDISF